MKKEIKILAAIWGFILVSAILPLSSACSQSGQKLQELKINFRTPPMDCRPYTYWWWPGSAVTREEITWELEQMHEKGIGGALITSAASCVYEKGNIAYLSDEYFAMVKHAIHTAKSLNMKVYLNFSLGWAYGGSWLAQEDRSKSLVPAWVDLQGPAVFAGALPRFKKAADRRGEIRVEDIPDTQKLVAVVAGKVVDGKIDQSSIITLTAKVKNNSLTWQAPEGNWRLMVFWLKYTGQRNAAQDVDLGKDHWTLDHFNKAAVTRYLNYIGGKFYKAFGDEFGKTLEALHCDSFELANLPNGIYWSDGLMEEFRQFKGYDLTKYLPAIWWDAGEITPKIRYDVSEFLHHVGIEAFYKPLLSWCEDHNIKASIQPIGFPSDVLETAGLTHLPEMEITPGEKDAVPWFDTRIGPKKYIASGAHLYGRNIVDVEAYTYIHWELYRTTLEELKIAGDGFLRSGANHFINHGYSYSPERYPAPSREIPFAARITPTNIWWKYYPLLSGYVARCSYLLRQGEFSPDIGVYSPLANQWTLSVLNARKWTREFYWGNLGKLLIANGYDFDLLNDDALQHFARIEDGKIKIRNLEYKILIIPNIKALPLKTLEFIQNYVREGGVVIALERVPVSSVGLADYARKDEKVKSIVQEMFKEPVGDNGTGPMKYGKGRTYYIKLVINRQDVLDWRSSALDPFVNTLREHLLPAFGIDFAQQGLRENNGLTFIHRTLNDTDIYFVTNIQSVASTSPITFRIKDKIPWKWNPYNGKISPVFQYRKKENGTEIPIRLAPYESTFFVFEKEQDSGHVIQSNFYDISRLSKDEIEALAIENGNYHVTLKRDNRQHTRFVHISDVPSPFIVSGEWKLTLKGRNFQGLDTTLTYLSSWTDTPRSEHFSGTGRYEISFELPKAYVAKDKRLLLDLGKIGNVGEVKLNDVNVGTVWMRGQTLDITDAVRPGKNHLVVLVTNTLINRVSGFKEPPPVPKNLVPHYGSGTTPFSAGFRGPIGFKPLPASGLMGPVKITALKKINISVE